jgi:hypothetical protein
MNNNGEIFENVHVVSDLSEMKVPIPTRVEASITGFIE